SDMLVSHLPYSSMRSPFAPAPDSAYDLVRNSWSVPMSVSRPPFKHRLKEALDAPNLELALTRALTQFRDRRGASFAPGEFEPLRDELVRRKNAAIERLPELVDQFTREAEKVGAVVHRARDADEACRIIGRL